MMKRMRRNEKKRKARKGRAKEKRREIERKVRQKQKKLCMSFWNGQRAISQQKLLQAR
jgi:hypothetical protein